MGQFSQNEAKSNGYNGFQIFYNSQNLERNVFDRLVAAKNRYFGLFFHASSRLSVSNSLLAENSNNVEMRWSDDIMINDTEIRGISSITKHLVHPPYFNRPCTEHILSPVGYRMQTNIYQYKKGAQLTNVHFSLFDHDDECSNSFPIAFQTYHRYTTKLWDYTSTFQNVTFDGKKTMAASAAHEAGVLDIIITDPDGNSDPAGQSFGPASFVSNVTHLTGLSHGSCSVYDEGIAYCNNTCLRTVKFVVDQAFSEDYDLKVTRIEDDAEVIVPAYYAYDNNQQLKRAYQNQRMYSIPIPFGTYTITFFQNGTHVWPTHVYVLWEGFPNCEGYGSMSNINVIEPILTNDHCDELFINSYVDNNGLAAWKHRNTGYLELLTGAGINGTDAIRHYRNAWWDGLGQYVDTRCFSKNVNELYEIKAWFRLQNDTVPVICDLFDSSYPNRCPSITLERKFYKDMKKENLGTHYLSNIAQTVMPNNSGNFSLVHGILKIDNILQNIASLYLYIEHFDQKYDIILNSFSVTKLKKSCVGDFIRNGDFESGYSSFFNTYGTAKYSIVNSSYGYSLKVYDRKHSNYGVHQNLYIDLACINEGDRFLIQGRFQLEDAQGKFIECDRKLNECSFIQLWRESIDEGRKHDGVATTVAINPKEYKNRGNWSLMTGIFTFGKLEANHVKMYLILAGGVTDTVIYDNISMIALAKTCDQVIVNPSFEDGTSSFWKPNYYYHVDYSIIRPGSSDSKFAILFQHSYSRATLGQSLDTRCIVEEKTFVLSAKIKLLNATDLSKPLACDPGERNIHAPNHCPTMRIEFHNCNDGNADVTLWNEKQSPWVPDDFNHYQYDFTVTSRQESCKNVQIQLGYYLPLNQAIVIYEIKLSEKGFTKSPTVFPTKTYTNEPTDSPTITTESPTTSVVQSCPPVGSSSIQVGGNDVILQTAEANTLCTLTKFLPSKAISEIYSLSRKKYKLFSANKEISFIPIARSYNLNNWEVSAGDTASSSFDTKEFLCYSQGCQINLPILKEGATYYLTSYTYSLSQRDEYARFFETASYGMTKAELDSFDTVTGEKESITVITDFIESQMNEEITPVTSHREFWRKRSNPRVRIFYFFNVVIRYVAFLTLFSHKHFN